MLTGGCFCGQLRYEIRGTPFNSTICHCVDCRRVAGSPAVAWFSVRPADIAVLSGAPHRFASSKGVTRGFCRECGTPLTYQRDDLPDELDITTATLDQPEQVPPLDRTYMRHRLAWSDDGLPTLPSYERGRPSGG